jgi:NADH dehydrogenase (ubiquinone) 1 alpha subcomplex subunit 8
MALRQVQVGRSEADRLRSIKDINENCLSQFRTHWQCLENHNQQLWNCRSEERRLNNCVFEKLVWFPSISMDDYANERAGLREEDTRYTQG